MYVLCIPFMTNFVPDINNTVFIRNDSIKVASNYAHWVHNADTYVIYDINKRYAYSVYDNIIKEIRKLGVDNFLNVERVSYELIFVSWLLIQDYDLVYRDWSATAGLLYFNDIRANIQVDRTILLYNDCRILGFSSYYADVLAHIEFIYFEVFRGSHIIALYYMAFGKRFVIFADDTTGDFLGIVSEIGIVIADQSKRFNIFSTKRAVLSYNSWWDRLIVK